MRPGGDDRIEADPLRSAAAHLDLQRQRQLPLGATAHPAGDHMLERGIGELGGRPDARHLA